MKKILKRIRRSIRTFFRRVFRLNEIYRRRAQRLLKKRAQKKKKNGDPITVSFVCHDPALWIMFESVYNAMKKDSRFYPQVIVLPNKLDRFSKKKFRDSRMEKYCAHLGLNMVEGFDASRMKWKKPNDFDSDYLFYQQPYLLFPKAWSIEHVSRRVKVCHIPYAFALFEWANFYNMNIPELFLQHTYFVFHENTTIQQSLKKRCGNTPWFSKIQTRVSGYPKFDYFDYSKKLKGAAWKRGLTPGVKRILWTPRWNTDQGTCHFFDYKDFLHHFCSKNEQIDFVFRPHPLCFKHFLKTGELSEKELENMRLDYSSSSQMSIDETYNYQDTFLTSDILISDHSSMLIEYFATGKPVVFTYTDGFSSDFGQEFSKGYYWVKNKVELKETLNMLIQGEDPLFETRKQIIQEMIYRPQGGAGEKIKELLYEDFLHEITN